MEFSSPFSAARRSIPEEIAAVLREEILDGVHAPGVPLKQGHLAERFGTSQAPIREAFRLLVAEGLAVALPNRGVRVAGLDAAEAEEIGALRLKLEPELAAGAARHPGLVDVAAARSAIAEMNGVPSPARLMAANAAFHEALYRAAGQPVTVEVVRGLRARYERHLRLMWRMSGHAPVSNDEHEAMLAMVLAGEAEAVRDAMARHIAHSTDRILAVLGRNQSDAPAPP